MRRLLLIGVGLCACLGLIAGVATFVWGVTPREWDGTLDFKIAQMCQADDGRPACALLVQEATGSGYQPLVDVGRISTETWNLPANARVGDLVLCHVHQQDTAIDASDAVTEVDGCHS